MADEERINIRIRLRDAARFAQETRRAKKEIDDLGDAAERANRKSRGASGGFNILQRTLQVFNPLALVGGSRLALMAVGAAAATPAVIALVAALMPLVGLLGTLPAFALLAGQGLGVAALGLHGVMDAVGGLNGQIDPKKFAQLSRPAQDFALTLDSLKPRILSLQRSVQRGLFPGLTEGLHAASPALNQLQGPLAGTGRVLGLFGARLGRLVGSRGFLRDLRSQAYFNNIQLTRLGGGALHLVNVFRTLMVTSRPLVAWLVRLVAGWAATADRTTLAWRASGKLVGMFHTVQVTTSRVGRLLWALGSALFHIGAVGRTAIGGGLLLALLHGAQALDRWTQSTQGINALTGAFGFSRNVLADVAHFAAAIATGVGPGAVDLVRNLIAVLGPLMNGGGGGAVAGLQLYVGAFNALAHAILFLENTVPGATTVMSAFLALMIVNNRLQVAAFAKDGIGMVTRALRYLVVWTNAATAAEAAQMGVIGSVKALWGLLAEGLGTMRAVYIANTGVTNVSTLAVLRHAAASKISAVATTALTAATWLLNLALDANPVVLIALAIIGLGAALVLAYTKVGWFRNGVQTAFGWVKAHWPMLLGIITGPIGLAVGFVVGHFDTIKHAASSAFGFIARLWNRTLGKIHFKVPGWVPGMGGHSFGIPKVPGYANGTLFHPGGLAIVGERGPELLSLPRAARVDPLPAPTLRAPRLTPVTRSGGGRGGSEPIHVTSHVTLKVDRRTLAKAVAEAVADETARG